MNWIEQGQNATAPPGASNSNITSNASTSVTQLGSLKTSAFITLKCILCLIHLLLRKKKLYSKCGQIFLIMAETKVDVIWLPNGKQHHHLKRGQFNKKTISLAFKKPNGIEKFEFCKTL